MDSNSQLNKETKGNRVWAILMMVLIPAFAIFLLLFFMVMNRVIHQLGEVSTLSKVDFLDVDVPLPAPPPPPPAPQQPITPPTPPPLAQLQELPKVDLSINPEAPALMMSLEKQDLDIEMKETDFRKVLKAPPKPSPPKKTYTQPQNTWKPQPKSQPQFYSAKNLDYLPSLVYKPHLNFPRSLKDQGLWQGKVVLEVVISSTGRVQITRVLSSSHPSFIPLAYNFASRARFSSPKKNGKSVNAKFNWPIVLKP